jgi:hypothetical protein
MAHGKKFCSYKDCNNEDGHTLFRFPSDTERFRSELMKYFKNLICLPWIFNTKIEIMRKKFQ